MSELLSLTEAARRLGGVSVRTLYRLRNDGKIKFTKVRGSSFVRDVELERYMAAAERTSRVA